MGSRGFALNKVASFVVTVVIVYGVFQVTIGELLCANLDDFAAQIADAPANEDGARGPVALRSSDLCTLLTDAGVLKGWGNRIAFPHAGVAASRLKAQYRFTSANGCSKYNVYNQMIATPVAR